MSGTERGSWCVVPAAGRGTRFGSDVPKQYLPIGGKPMLMWTLERLAMHPRVEGLVVALAADDPRWPGAQRIAGKPVRTVVGGASRSDSVLAGLRDLSPLVGADEYVLVHDAARPCVAAADVSRLVERAGSAGGGLLATPVRDTLKRADGAGRVVATEPRASFWRALTPQMFRLGELTAALESAQAAGIDVTDEAMAMELTGFRPLLVEGAASNIKVTTAEDLGLAQYLLYRERGEGRGERGTT